MLLVRRKRRTEIGKLALPGGFVEIDETVEHAAVREAKEETGLDVKLLEILGAYANDVDPKKTISTVFITEILGGKEEVSEESEEIVWAPLNEIKFDEMAFGHGKVLEDYLRWKEQGGTYWMEK